MAPNYCLFAESVADQVLVKFIPRYKHNMYCHRTGVNGRNSKINCDF
jgi:hypothetical protein